MAARSQYGWTCEAPVRRTARSPSATRRPSRIDRAAAGAEQRGRGEAAIDVTATLTQAGPSAEVSVAQDLQLSALPPVRPGHDRRCASVLMHDFSANMAAQIDAAARGGT